MKINQAKFNIGDIVFIPLTSEDLGSYVVQTTVLAIVYFDGRVRYFVAGESKELLPEEGLHATISSAAMAFPQ